MSDDTIPQTVLFPDLFAKPLVATFDQAHASWDGGAILLKAPTDAWTSPRGWRPLTDVRDPARVTHALTDVLAQRVFGIAAGYPDGNDADRLAEDPIQKLLLDRYPVQGQALASQPTISRFENGVGPRALYRVGRELAATVIDRHRQRLRGRARRITIDLDGHGRSDAWRAAIDLLSRALRHLVLRAAPGV